MYNYIGIYIDKYVLKTETQHTDQKMYMRPPNQRAKQKSAQK